jgi:hypothetical protein
LFVILFSDARQGILSAITGLSFVFLIMAFYRNKKFGMFLGLIFLVIGIMSILGMLQKGPLASILYKDSVSVRGFYWRAAISMFKENPIFGVGIDSYGLYFKEYREAQYPLKYGFTLTSTNAHNTFLQFFSTAGFIVGMSYVVFIIMVLYTALRFVNRIHKSNNFIFYLSVLGAWIAFQAQSIISIDNIGISIWNWVLAGILLGISIEYSVEENKESTLRNSNHKQSFSAIISWVLFIPAFVLVSLLYRGENESIKLRDNINYEGMTLQESTQFQANKVNSLFLVDPYYKFLTVNPLNAAGFEEQGLQILTNSHLSNPRNADYLESLARFYENKQSFDQAIKYREKIHKLDPWNAENILSLGLNYKLSNKIQEMELCLDKILSFASQDQIAIRAKNELRV